MGCCWLSVWVGGSPSGVDLIHASYPMAENAWRESAGCAGMVGRAGEVQHPALPCTPAPTTGCKKVAMTSMRYNHSIKERAGQFVANKHWSWEAFDETFLSKPEVTRFALIPLCGFWRFNFKERMWVWCVCFISFSFLSFWALYFKLISWKRVRVLSSGVPAVTFRSGEPRVYFSRCSFKLDSLQEVAL